MAEKLLTLYGTNIDRKCTIVTNSIRSVVTNMYARYMIEGTLDINTKEYIIFCCHLSAEDFKKLSETAVFKIFKTDGKKVLEKKSCSLSDWILLLESVKNPRFSVTKVLNGEFTTQFRVIKV